MSKPPPLPPRAASPGVPSVIGSVPQTSPTSLPALPPRRPSTSQVTGPITTSTSSYGGYASPTPTYGTASSTAALPKLPPRTSSASSPSFASRPIATATPPSNVSPPLSTRRTSTPPPPLTVEPTQPTYIQPMPRSLSAMPKAAGLPSLPPFPNRAPQPQQQPPQLPPQQQNRQSYGSTNPFAPQATYGTAPPNPSISSSNGSPSSQAAVPPKLPSRNSTPPQQTAPALGFAHPDVSNIKTSAKLAKIMETALKKLGYLGIAVVVVKQGKIIDRGALGLRKAGSNVPITLNDKWHLGSCTKSFAGTLAGKMVSQGKISWKTTIAQVFPDLVGKMNSAYQNVTLAQLFQHRGGIPSLLNTNWTRTGVSLAQQRFEMVAATLASPPQVAPGTELYSNSSTTIAAAMLERVDGRNKTWEELNLEEVCEPLGLTSAGYGTPATDSVSSTTPDQPWGHKRSANGTFEPTNGDNPQVIAPAALLHLSADDFARWLIVQVEGHNGKFIDFMSKDSWRAIHTPVAGSNPLYYAHAIGWLATESMLTHDGSNLTWWCRMWASTKTKDALVICTNGEIPPSDVAESIASDIRKQLLGLNF